MGLALTGKRIALAEGRQLEDLAAMLEREGATVIRCPMIGILDAPDDAPILAWLQRLIARRFSHVVLMTGEGLRRLLGTADRAGLRAQVVEALAASRIVTRGPKPGQALRDVGLSPTLVAKAPTTQGVIETLLAEPISGTTVGVQLYSESNEPLVHALTGAGATADTVSPYVYAPAADGDRIVDLIHRMDRGEVDAVVFTSSPQVDRLLEVATQHGLADELLRGVQRTRIAAVGPVIADSLKRHQMPVHICPEQGFVMKNLVKHIKDDLTRQS